MKLNKQLIMTNIMIYYSNLARVTSISTGKIFISNKYINMILNVNACTFFYIKIIQFKLRWNYGLLQSKMLIIPFVIGMLDKRPYMQ